MRVASIFLTADGKSSNPLEIVLGNLNSSFWDQRGAETLIRGDGGPQIHPSLRNVEYTCVQFSHLEGSQRLVTPRNLQRPDFFWGVQGGDTPVARWACPHFLCPLGRKRSSLSPLCPTQISQGDRPSSTGVVATEAASLSP